LEFIQSLASPAYLHYLATTGILYQSSFLDFLRYLRYWKKPEYAKYLVYPNCLYFLDLMVPPDDDEEDESTEGDKEQTTKKKVDRGEAFRREMAQVQFRNFVHEQQFYSWQFRSGRLYGKGEALKEENEETNNNGQEANQEGAN
jgi:mediator of RNA polymerase II transcription subunit 31